jgi:hypothetical protein
MHKRHYIKHVKEHYQARTNIETNLELSEEYLMTKDKSGEGKILLTEITYVDETKHHLFIRFATNTALIIPRRQRHSEELKAELQQKGIRFNEDLDWKW